MTKSQEHYYRITQLDKSKWKEEADKLSDDEIAFRSKKGETISVKKVVTGWLRMEYKSRMESYR